jgi:hypothetical protein
MRRKFPIKSDILLYLSNMQMAVVITGSDVGNPMTSLNSSSDSFVFTLQLLHCYDETEQEINLSLRFCKWKKRDAVHRWQYGSRWLQSDGARGGHPEHTAALTLYIIASSNNFELFKNTISTTPVPGVA